MIKTFLFDLDGTLINTNELILASFQFTLDQFFPGKFQREELIPFLGEPLEVSFNRVDPGLADEMIDLYRDHNRRFHDQLVKDYPLVRETLAELAEMGCRLGVVTTKQRDMVNKGLHLSGIADYFGSIITIDDVIRPKPDAEPVVRAMAELAAEPESTLMIGDSPSDIEAGRNAQVRTAGVSWSIKGRYTLEKENPDFLINKITDLLQFAVSGSRQQ
ncbi:pyrophosphatase PpaX [Sporolactobacillus sp. THM7-4]|nr:pyrophosphatase PpaX [Sporolactobacillus sp. THM7-4]